MDQHESIDAVKVHETQHLNETINPTWYINDLKIQTLCNSDQNLPILFEVWNYSDDGSHEQYGYVQTTLQGIQSSTDRVFTLKSTSGGDNGTLTLSQFLVYEQPSMMDYLRSGWIMSLSSAIDFTASNGELSDPHSLHYINPNNPQVMNSYEEAIYQVGNILEPYDSNRQFPVFGFGGIPRFMGINDISHCFHLNGSENPEVTGTTGILEAYRNAIFGGIGLYGPTNFAPCLQSIIHYVKSRLHISEYTIMLYITDGAITDMDETIDAIVEASNLPISVIIIGVGDSNFSKMDLLDGDRNILQSKSGTKTARDIVQFVEFNNYRHDISLLPEAVLHEVPKQMVAYMQKNNIKAAPTDFIPTNEVIHM